MKNLTFYIKKMKRKCNLLSFFFLLLLCIPVAILIGLLIGFTAPTIYRWGVYLLTNIGNAQDIIEIVLFFMMMGGLIILLFAAYFILLDLLIYVSMLGFVIITKCYKESGVVISIVIFKVVSIISAFLLKPSFIDPMFESAILSVVFIFLFIIVGFCSLVYISSVVMPENLVDTFEEELEELVEMLNDDEANTRKEAISIIEERGYSNLIDKLIPMLEDNDEFVRIYVAMALGTLGNKSVLDQLKKAKLSVQEDNQFYFDEAISRLSEKS